MYASNLSCCDEIQFIKDVHELHHKGLVMLDLMEDNILFDSKEHENASI